MMSNEKVGWRLNGLVAGIVVSSLMVLVSFAAAAFFSESNLDHTGEQQATASRQVIER